MDGVAERVRIGLLGGTFDPPHIGHLFMAERAAEILNLRQILYVPVGDPPHKQDIVRSPVKHRLAMLECALDGNPLFSVSHVDIERPGPHYSADMVGLLQREYPDATLYFIMGADSLRDLPKWHAAERLFPQCQLVVYPRVGVSVHPAMHEEVLPGLAEQVIMLDAPLIEVSSTSVAEWLAQGRTVRYLVPDSVLAYIEETDLYRGSS